jgi:uncharacterized glyoxalase superfamily protein PhnB
MGMHGFALTLSYPTVEQATRCSATLAAGGTITMPIQKTCWAEAFGMLRKRFQYALDADDSGLGERAGSSPASPH